jgi:serine/threonine protein phosphatase 1
MQRAKALRWAAFRAGRLRTGPIIPANIRVYAVGDVHGRADLLIDLFGRIDADLRARPIAVSVQVFLGDYIDRGPQSRRVVDLMIERQKTNEILCLKGNHEVYAFQFLNDPTVLTAWKRVGGLETLLSYGIMPNDCHDLPTQRRLAMEFGRSMPDSHRHFIKGLELSFTCGDFFFVHAGVRPGIALNKQSEQDLLWIRDEFLLCEENFGKVVVHGHTPAIEPDIRPNRINIDTGAYATGRLTCLVLQGNQMRFL